MRTVVFLGSVAAVAACARGGSAPSPTTTAAPAPARTSPATDPTSLTYSPGSSRYRVVTEQHMHQEVMGQINEMDLGSTVVLTAVASAQAGNLAVAFTLDSVTMSGSAPTQGAGLAGLRGRTFNALFSPTGRLVSIENPDTGNAAVGQMVGELRDFFPVLPSGPLTAGAAWSDTTADSVNLGEMRMHTRSVRQHRIVGWEAREGLRVLHLATTTSFTIEGSGEAQGQALQLSGTGRGMFDHYVAATGYVGTTASDSTTMTVNVVSVGIEVPVRRTSRTSVTRLP